MSKSRKRRRNPEYYRNIPIAKPEDGITVKEDAPKLYVFLTCAEYAKMLPPVDSPVAALDGPQSIPGGKHVCS